MKIYLILIFSLFTSTLFAKVPTKKKIDPINFFIKQYESKETKWSFNEYENIISGTAAFIIGNIGYATTDSSVLGISYSAIQTIGIINIGQGIYKMNSPSIEGSFKDLLTNKRVKAYSKPKLAKHLIKIFGEEERAKRLSLFYSSSLLSIQYLFNATVYDSPGNVDNIYIFLGGINAIVATYSAFYKSDYEKALLGDNIDLNPFAFKTKEADLYGLQFVYNF
jgi:hypothetical protein